MKKVLLVLALIAVYGLSVSTASAKVVTVNNAKVTLVADDNNSTVAIPEGEKTKKEKAKTTETKAKVKKVAKSETKSEGCAGAKCEGKSEGCAGKEKSCCGSSCEGKKKN